MAVTTRWSKFAHRALSLQGLRASVLISAVVAVGGGLAFSAAEGRHLSAWDGIYWSLVTMTTVGYGDITPHTTLGRIIAIAVMFVGIGLVAVLTAALAGLVAHRIVKDSERDLAADIEIAEGELVTELRDVMQRLQQLEKLIRQLERHRPAPPPLQT